jgi:hypothetical protein
MPEQDQSTPHTTDDPTVTPPTIDPAEWENFMGFREVFLAYFPGARENGALRVVSTFLYDLILEAAVLQPEPPEGSVRTQIRAAVADLRFLQGFLAFMGQDAEATAHTPHEEHICRLMGKRSVVLEQLADEIEAQLGAWRGETEV